MKGRKVVIKRKFTAPIQLVFKAFVDPKIMTQWFSPDYMTTPNATSDLRVGGKYSVTMAFNDNRQDPVTVRGVYKEIEEFNKLVFTWKWDGHDEETNVLVELESIADDETELKLTHSGFMKPLKDYAVGQSPIDHEHGWTTGLAKLSNTLAAVS